MSKTGAKRVFLAVFFFFLLFFSPDIFLSVFLSFYPLFFGFVLFSFILRMCGFFSPLVAVITQMDIVHPEDCISVLHHFYFSDSSK